jgi:hypothetical protein
MNQRTKNLLLAGALLFTIGAILGIALTAAGVWADLEANFYGFDKISDRQFSTLRCPVLMSSAEAGRVTASFSNPTETRIQPLIRADISSRGLFESQRAQLPLEPGETKSLSWTVDSENIDMGDFIFVKVSQYPASILPAREAVCGIMVVNLLGISGNVIFWLALVASILGMLIGLFLLDRANQQMHEKLPNFRRLGVFMALVLLGLFASLTGRWLIGGVLLAGIILGAAAILGSLLLSEN